MTLNLNTLDTILRTLTPNERKYKNGSDYYDYDSLPLVNRDGVLYRLMHIGEGESNSTANNRFKIKKQSRYQAVPSHIHNWIELNFMYEGACPQIINKHPITLEKGQLLLIGTDVPHETTALGDNDIMVSILLNKGYLDTNFFQHLSKDSILSQFFINAIDENTKHDSYILFHSENNRRVSFFFNEILCETYDPSLNSDDIIDSLFTLIIAELINIYENDISQLEFEQNQAPLLPILRYIEGNYAECTLEKTAQFFNMNPNYLTTLLKQKLGLSYKELVQQQRLRSAAKLLRNTNFTIARVANEVGYENISFFNQIFRRYYKVSPKEYRIASELR